MLVSFDYVPGCVVDANDSVMRAAEKLRITYRVAGPVRLAIPESTEGQHIGNEIGAAFIFAWSDFVKVHVSAKRFGVLFSSFDSRSSGRVFSQRPISPLARHPEPNYPG